MNCVTWDKLSDIPNVRDYDVLVINLLSIKTEADRKKVDWVKFNELLSFHAASDILTHEGKIFVLGDPRFEIPKSKTEGAKQFLDWTGATFVWDKQPGDTIRSNNWSDLKNYEKHLRTWNYSLARCSLNENVFEEKWDLDGIRRKGYSVWVETRAACANRYDHAIAFCIFHQIRNEYRVHISYGPDLFFARNLIG